MLYAKIIPPKLGKQLEERNIEMALSKADKAWLVKLATVMMNHLAWMISRGRSPASHDTGGAQKDWTDGTEQSFKEKCTALLK